MSNVRKRRTGQRKLKAHDRGENRHNKALQWMLKRNRTAAERNRLIQAQRGW